MAIFYLQRISHAINVHLGNILHWYFLEVKKNGLFILARSGFSQLACRRHVPEMGQPKEEPGIVQGMVLLSLRPCGNASSRPSGVLGKLGEQWQGSGAVTACPRWHNPRLRTWGTEGAWAVPDGSIEQISPLPTAQSRFETRASHWVLSWVLSLLLSQRSHPCKEGFPMI